MEEQEALSPPNLRHRIDDLRQEADWRELQLTYKLLKALSRECKACSIQNLMDLRHGRGCHLLPNS
jgi:hypothetical protein